MNNVTIFLTPVDAEKYKMFLEHYDFFNLLIEKRVNKQKSCAITLHIDHEGTIKNIARADVLYDFRTKFDNTN